MVEPKKSSGAATSSKKTTSKAEAGETEFFTKDELKSIVQELLDGQTNDLRSLIENLQAELEETQNIATGAQRRVEECEKQIVKLENENDSLKAQMSLIENNDSNNAKIKELEVRIEDRTNRQLRNTLTFKGITDSPKETWSETELKLVSHFTNAGVPATEAKNMIERAHRGRPNPDRPGPRPIYARFLSWKDSERVKKLKIYDTMSSNRMFVDQKYGPLTTKRRNLALLERRNLKREGTIVQGYLKFPAQLWVKYSAQDEHYKHHMDFSNHELN